MTDEYLDRTIQAQGFNSRGLVLYYVPILEIWDNEAEVVFQVGVDLHGNMTLEELMGDPDGLGLAEAFDAFDENHVLTEEEAQSIADLMNEEFAEHIWGNYSMERDAEEISYLVEQFIREKEGQDLNITIDYKFGRAERIWHASDVLKRWHDYKN